MSIAIAPSNKEFTVRKISAEEITKHRLRELGITEGSPIRLLSASGGNVIVIVKEGRLCLDRTLASKIIVA